jgi:hypothetical protein
MVDGDTSIDPYGWVEAETQTTTCRCIQKARLYLDEAQKLNEIDGMGGHAFFTLGCAVNALINHADGDHDPAGNIPAPKGFKFL